MELAATALRAVRDRNGLDTAGVDDVILGCVEPVGEQGAVIARTAVVVAGYAESVAGVQINRFCASGLEAVNIAAAKVKAGEADLAIGGGVESMSRIPMGSSGGAIATDPRRNAPDGLRAAGHLRRSHRDPRGLHARGRRRVRRRVTAPRCCVVGREAVCQVDRSGRRRERDDDPRPRPARAGGDDDGVARRVEAGVRDAGRHRLRRRRDPALSRHRAHRARPHRR